MNIDTTVGGSRVLNHQTKIIDRMRQSKGRHYEKTAQPNRF